MKWLVRIVNLIYLICTIKTNITVCVQLSKDLFKELSGIYFFCVKKSIAIIVVATNEL